MVVWLGSICNSRNGCAFRVISSHCARRITMQKLHKMLLAVIILAAMTVIGTWMLSSHTQEGFSGNGWTNSQIASATLSPSCIKSPHRESAPGQLIQFPCNYLGNASDGCAQPGALIPPLTADSETLGHGINTRLAMVSSQASTKWHANPRGVCAGASLYVPTVPLLFGPTHIVTPSIDRILDIPLNRGPTS